MNLGAEVVAKIRLAGLMHDVGTLGSMRDTSEKHEMDMSANEMELFQTHPQRGQELFKSLKDLQDVGQILRGHHEAFDGSGFPDGLKNEDIPLGARLIAIADFIENAANSVSDERADYSLMKARLHAGTLLDPKLIPYFTTITRILYFEGKKSGTPGEVEVPLSELISGMQLSRNLSSEAGVLLLQKGDKLDFARIALIRRSSKLSRSPEAGVWMVVNYSE